MIQAVTNRESDPQPLPGAEAPPATSASAGGSLPIPFDPLRLVVALRRRWFWPFAPAFLLAGLAALFGLLKFHSQYKTSIQLIRRELSMSFRTTELGEPFKPRQFTAPTVVNMMRSPSLLQAAGNRARRRWSVSELAGGLVITPEKNTDLINVSLGTARGAGEVSEMINLYADEVVKLLKSLQTQEASELNKFLKQQLVAIDNELAAINRQMLEFSREEQYVNADKETDAYFRELSEMEMKVETARIELETIDFKIAGLQRELDQQSPLVTKRAAARERLNALLVSYTAENPLVLEAQTRLAALEQEMQRQTTNGAPFQMSENTVANALYLDVVGLRSQKASLSQQLEKLGKFRDQVQAKLQKLPERVMQYSRLKAKQDSLEMTRSFMAGRQKEAQLFEENALGYYRVFAPAGLNDVSATSRGKKIVLMTIVGGVLGLIGGLLLVCFLEMIDSRVVTRGDLRRLSSAKVLARLGDLDSWSDEEKGQWAFRAWSQIHRNLNQDGSVVCGVISAQAGEGRSTIIEMLARAARQRGHRVLAITNRPPPSLNSPEISLAGALNLPETVSRRLNGRELEPLFVQCPADFRWTLEQREAWRSAWNSWQSVPSLVCLIELPPAQTTDTLLMAAALPQVLWLASSGLSRSTEAAAVLDDLRQADGRVAGAILNREPRAFSRLPNLEKFGLLLLATAMLGFCRPGSAQTVGSPGTVSMAIADSDDDQAAAGPHSFGAVASAPREPLKLGPGDVLDLSLYGTADSTRSGVTINPDGTISYLNAQNVPAAGLTVDQLRERLNEQIRKNFRTARVVINPVAFRSRKYYLLGTIMDRGAYYLDRPITIIEAVAKARGFSTGLYMQNTVELVDLPRAFLMRGGKRMPVDFQKLFSQGDLSQNLLLEAGDYMYFPSSSINEVYVLGSVVSPGPIGVTPNATALSVIIVRGGFAEKAFRKRVLVVRGSLDKPKTTIVDCDAILAGRAKDFLIEPKDIIYVADKPWARAEELLDMAAAAFTQAAIATWTGGNLGPFITYPILPSTR